MVSLLNRIKALQFSFLLKIIGLVPLIIWAYYYINYDLWYDEVCSLELFVLTDWKTTMFYYPAPNNHVLYNLINQVVTRLIDLRDINLITENVFIFRSFQLGVTLLTVYYSSLLVKQFFKENYNGLVFVILLTTIPFLNFSLQLRGYITSALFLVMLVFYSMKYVKSNDSYSKTLIVLCSFLLLYTLPSNLYFLVSIWVLNLYFWIYYKRKDLTLSKKHFNVLVCIGIGSVLALLFYLPIIDQVVNNKYSSRSVKGVFQVVYTLKSILIGFLSKRYFLLFLVIPGVYLFLKEFNKKNLFWYLIFILFLPFLFSFLHQKNAFQRVFIPLAPIFSIVMALSISYLLSKVPNSKIRNAILLILSVYCVSVFVKEIKNNYHTISKNMIDNEILIQNSYQNYYLGSFFKQDNVAKLLNAEYNNAPVFIFNHIDTPSTELYLRKYDIPFSTIDSLNNIFKKEIDSTIFIITSHLKSTLTSLDEYEKLEIKVRTSNNSFTSIIQCNFKN